MFRDGPSPYRIQCSPTPASSPLLLPIHQEQRDQGAGRSGQDSQSRWVILLSPCLVPVKGPRLLSRLALRCFQGSEARARAGLGVKGSAGPAVRLQEGLEPEKIRLTLQVCASRKSHLIHYVPAALVSIHCATLM